MNKPVRTRFAPSPTGLLHIGGVRTALFSYLFAKANNGTFVLRLEDTDRERFVEAGVEQIMKSLDWLGIHPDEGVWLEQKPTPHGSYIQSERLPHYLNFAKKLVDKGLAYYSSITAEAFSALREEAISAKKPFVYKHTMEPAPTSLSTENLPIRLKVGEGETVWQDELRGEFKTNNYLIDDFIILKADGFPTYNFAHVIDDYLMQITHVIRGDEFISSTPKYAYLIDALNIDRPKWIHLPPILGPDGRKKLSKRDGDVDVLDYKAKGYLPEALVNFLALLGWNDGSEQEVFELKELIDKFEIQDLNTSPAVFDINRLNWLNGEYIRKMSVAQLMKRLEPFLPKQWYNDKKYLEKVLLLDKDRIKKLDKARYLMEIFFEKPIVDDNLLTKKSNKTDIQVWFQEFLDQMHQQEFNREVLESTILNLAKKHGVNPGKVYYVLRIALTGREAAPSVVDIILTLGRNEVASRIKKVSG